jgi:hypothetical protein
MEECTQFHHSLGRSADIGVPRQVIGGRTNRSSELGYFTLHVMARTPATVKIEG